VSSGEQNVPVTIEAAAAPAEAAAPDQETAIAPTASDNGSAPAAPAFGADAQAAYEAERQRLDDELARQQGVVTQLESVQAALGAGTPAGVLQSLDEARAALAKAQADRDALQPPGPAVDPAEIVRLNEEIVRQQGIVTQLESVQSMLGAGTPAGVLQSLDEARAALAKAQADLQGLGAGAPSAPAASAAPAQSQSQAADAATAVQPQAPTEAAPAQPQAAPTEAAQPQPAVPAVSGPRLVVDENGSALPLAADKSEYVIGREDPISGIYPEVDLTPYGGESGGVSRQHARLTRSGGQWTLTDLNSTNHTRVNGTRLEPNKPTEIQDGAKLQFGRLALTFHA
jgi:pSer/pThr/pTyr-binding forkhead associated (FHA) protein